MSASDDAGSATAGPRIMWLPILYTAIFGVVSGTALTAIAYYRIVLDDNGAVIVFAAVAILAWLVAGFLAARAAWRALPGALTGLFAGILGVVIGFFAHQALMQQYGDAWYERVAHCVTGSGTTVCIDKPTFLANEASLTAVTLIFWPIVALILGLIAGYVGATSAARRPIGDEYQGGTITLHPSLIPSHRTVRGHGQDVPQGDRPSLPY
jgi:hypothetical protein